MSEFTDQHYFPRATSSESVRSLVALRGTSPRGTPVEDLLDVPFDLKQAQFHPNATNRVDEDALLTWRVELNSWAQKRKHHPISNQITAKTTGTLTLVCASLMTLAGSQNSFTPTSGAGLHRTCFRTSWSIDGNGRSSKTKKSQSAPNLGITSQPTPQTGSAWQSTASSSTAKRSLERQTHKNSRACSADLPSGQIQGWRRS